MSTQRYISTGFWDDEWIQTLDPSEKLLYLYLMTNPLTNIAGVYKITSRRVSFDTGFNNDTINNIMGKFMKAGKAHRVGEYIVLPSWPQHQAWHKSDRIKQGIESLLRELPEKIKNELKRIGYRYPIDTLCIPYAKGLSYSDLDLDLDRDRDSDRDKDKDSDCADFSFSPESKDPFQDEDPWSPEPPLVKPEQPQGKAYKDLDRIREHWNSKGSLPKFRHQIISMPPEQTGPALRTLGTYSAEEVMKAIDNYAAVIVSPDHEAFPKYAGLPGFLKSGPDSYDDESLPFARCMIVKPDIEAKADREVREAKEELRRIRARNQEASA